jgi:hypothetical protein
VFEAFRKPQVVEEDVVTSPARVTGDPALRAEVDPDPLVEEMTARLREGLSSLVAVDEWGRELAWRNVVRMALGPLGGRLRDAEQAAEIAVALLPSTEVGWPDETAVPEPSATEESESAMAYLAADSTGQVIEPLPSGDESAVAVRPVGAGELAGRSRPHDPTAAKYDGFLASLYGESQQVGRHEDGGTARPGLGDDL